MKKILTCLLLAFLLTGCDILQLNERENELLQKENNLQQREEELQQLESDLLQTKTGLFKLEEDLQKREEDLLQKETALQNLEEELQQRINEIPEGCEAIYVPISRELIDMDRAEYFVSCAFEKKYPDSFDENRDFVCENIEIINGKIYYAVRIHQQFIARFTTYGWYLVDVFTGAVYDGLSDERLEHDLQWEG